MSADPASAPADGIPGNSLPGPFAVGEYAAGLRRRLRELARVQITGELFNVRLGRARVFFELRDAGGALPCSAWRTDWERFERLGGALRDGAEVVLAGGCDFYPGSQTASPSFSFAVSDARLAGEGDLLARIERLRRTLHAEGLLETQRRLPRPSLPRSIGVVTGEGGKARDDLLAGLRRRGWQGRLVWAFAPVQDRRAAPAIARSVQDLAACGAVEVIVVARGGGSIADLMAFSDETLCRTVALLAVPVVASVGHHSDRTVLDDVAAVSCSTPTHAAEAAVPVHVGEEWAAVRRSALALDGHARRSVLGRARLLARQARAPAEHLERQRARLEQASRELRASAQRRVRDEGEGRRRDLVILSRRREASARVSDRERGAMAARTGVLLRAAALDRLTSELEHRRTAIAAHDPARTLARGYALVEDRDGVPVTGAPRARLAERIRVRFADGAVDAEIREDMR